LSGTVSKSRGDPSQSLQMIERPLMTVDELKSMAKGHFIVMKTGSNPMKCILKLFLKWGITFEESFAVPEHSAREVKYADKDELEQAIILKYPQQNKTNELADLPKQTRQPKQAPRGKNVRID